ncbi:MAG: SpoIIIAH-like family protein [Bacilli bacterium]
MNKQTLWFITLFSLVLVLGVYYVTMPNELLKSKNILEKANKEISTNVNKSDMFVFLRVERDEAIAKEMNNLEGILTSTTSSAEEKNNAFEELKLLNLVKGKEEFIEEKILNKLKIKSFVEIKDDQIKVVVSSKEHNTTLANNIMRTVQEEYDEKMYITVKFQ